MFTTLFRIAMGRLSLPNDLVNKLVLPENLVQHDLDIVAGVPVAVVVERAGFLQDAVHLHAPGPHEVDIRLRRGVQGKGGLN